MNTKNIYSILLTFIIIITLSLTGCKSEENAIDDGVDFAALKETGKWELAYAKEYSVTEYGDYFVVSIKNEGDYLIVPKDGKVPSNIPDDMTVLKKPLNCSYVVSSSSMDMIRQIDALNYIRMTGTKESDWYIDDVKKAMQNDEILYAGKYSEPDYELIINEGCNFALENTMISHKPQVKEKLIQLGIPVLVERSSYEGHPLGRLEWIKLYGLLYDNITEANEYFDSQIRNIEGVLGRENTGKTVAYFYVTSNGAVNVRKPSDYISKMIGLAGGKYVLDDYLDYEENALSTMNMQMEDFYANAKDADIIIYNSTIDGELKDAGDLISKNSLFADFKAVKEGKVYTTGGNFYQETTGICKFIEDVGKILSDENDNSSDELYFIKHMN